MSKREIIFDKTGFNVTNAININKESEKTEEVEILKESIQNRGQNCFSYV